MISFGYVNFTDGTRKEIIDYNIHDSSLVTVYTQDTAYLYQKERVYDEINAREKIVSGLKSYTKDHFYKLSKDREWVQVYNIKNFEITK